MNTLPTIQYYEQHWFDKVVPLLKTNERIRYELQRLCAERICRIESCLEPDLSLEDLDAELALEEHIARVRRTNFHWLKNNFDAFDIASLSQLVASELFPQKVWLELEAREECVITDLKRTMVFDLHHAHVLSARASLALCGDEPDHETKLELERFLGKRVASEEAVIDKLSRDLASQRETGKVIDLPNNK